MVGCGGVVRSYLGGLYDGMRRILGSSGGIYGVEAVLL